LDSRQKRSFLPNFQVEPGEAKGRKARQKQGSTWNCGLKMRVNYIYDVAMGPAGIITPQNNGLTKNFDLILTMQTTKKPKYGWYEVSNLEGLKMSDFS